MFAVGEVTRGEPPNNADHKAHNQDRIDIKLFAKEAEIEGTLAAGRVKRGEPGKQYGGSKRRQGQEFANSKSKREKPNPEGDDAPQASQKGTKISMCIDIGKIDTGENSIVATKNLEIDGDSDDHSFFKDQSDDDVTMQMKLRSGTVTGVVGAKHVKMWTRKDEESRKDDESNEKKREEKRQ